jgi:ferredoxin
MIRIIHFRNKCIGCFACVEADSDRWRVSRRDGKSILIDSVPKKDHFIATVSSHEMESVLAAERNCPVKVIRVVK